MQNAHLAGKSPKLKLKKQAFLVAKVPLQLNGKKDRETSELFETSLHLLRSPLTRKYSTLDPTGAKMLIITLA
jgi:hypothetical protein